MWWISFWNSEGVSAFGKCWVCEGCEPWVASFVPMTSVSICMLWLNDNRVRSKSWVTVSFLLPLWQGPRLGDLNQQTLIRSRFWSQESEISITRLKSGCQHGCSPFEARGDFFLPLPASSGCSHSLACAASLPSLPPWSTFRVNLENPGWSHHRILYLITSTKSLFPNRVTFLGCRYLLGTWYLLGTIFH